MAGAVPSEAIHLIQEFEGCAKFDPSDGLIHAYPDPASGAEPYTIGWGTTVYPNGTKVKPGDKISQQDADNYLATNVKTSFWDPLATKIPHWNEMNDKMRSALCSFGYNLGAGFYGSPNFKTITSCLREKRWQDVPKALMLYVNPGSSVEAGLRRRRDAEGDLWLAGLNELSGEAPSAQPVVLEAMTETFLKKENLDSSQLAPNQLVAIHTGKQWKIEKRLATQGNSQQVELAYGAGEWWIYLPHWKEATTTAAAPAAAGAAAAPTGEASRSSRRPQKSEDPLP
jgi:GH24 family phage-related lysozyme (muramidase)